MNGLASATLIGLPQYPNNLSVQASVIALGPLNKSSMQVRRQSHVQVDGLLLHDMSLPRQYQSVADVASLVLKWYWNSYDTDGDMPKRIDMTGRRFGHLVVIAGALPLNGNTRERCRCDCGNEVTVGRSNLATGRTSSCGCTRTDGARLANTTHGKTRTPVYRSWIAMRRRCSDSSYEHWADYGGRGITVCERWQSFENFYADMGERPEGASLDRIDADGNYEPGNCRWATKTEQARNRRNTPMLTFGGETLSYAEWATRMGVSVQTIHGRTRRGWTVEQVLGVVSPPPTMRGRR